MMKHGRNISGFKNRGLLLPLLAAGIFLLMLLAAACSAEHTGGKELEPVTEPSFSLNGEDYPLFPQLHDFTDRGWKLGRPVEQTGSYTEEEGPADLVATGYRLTSGSDEVGAYLNVEARRSGVEPEACKLRSLSIYGYAVESFCLDGNELTDIDKERILTVLGDPNSVEQMDYGVTYHYSMPEKSISDISFTFPN